VNWAATANTSWSYGIASRNTRGGAWTGTRWATPWSRPTRCTRTRGKKGIPHNDPADPPRRRANRRRGHGTFANDRPPIAGVVGRESGEFRSEVLDHADGAELEGVIECTTLEGTVVNTDEWKGYNGLPRMKRVHKTVDHSGPKSTWARDDDGDGVREVHCNTQEGLWTSVRNFLRRFYGLSKWYLAQYQAVFQWGYNIKTVTDEFLRILLGIRHGTRLAP
jgi:transposase